MKKYRSKKQLGRGFRVEKMNGNEDKYNGNYWQLFDIKLFGRDRSRVLNLLEEKLALGTKKYWIATVNPEFVMKATKDNDFKKILARTSLNVVDGIGLVWAKELDRRLLIVDRRNLVKKIIIGIVVGVGVLRGRYRDQVASGADLIEDLVKMAQKLNKKIFFLGGWGDRAEKSAKFLISKFLISNNLIRWCTGEPDMTNEEVIKKINNFKPDILLVAYGMKKQEFWIDKNLKDLDVGLVMGVGRSFDYYSGELKRAPIWIRKMGMEWLYSLIKEPKRFKRQLVLPKFVWKVMIN